MVRRLGWLLFIAAAGGLLFLSVVDLLPRNREAHGAFRHLAEHGVEKQAVVLGKREWTYTTYDGDTGYHFAVTLEHTEAGQAFRRELSFQPFALRREAWERIQPGQVIPIRALPDSPQTFYAPSFLSADALAPPTFEYGMHTLLGLSAAGLLAALLYFKVLRAPGEAAPGENPRP
jgi:hypothetical protein